jgi:hypothetical protein
LEEKAEWPWDNQLQSEECLREKNF